jgi:threonine aldolase
LARQAADELASAPGIDVLGEVVLNQVLFRIRDVDTATVIDRVQREGTCWLGGTTWAGEPAIRFSVCNWSTSANDITRSTTAITQAAKSPSNP